MGSVNKIVLLGNVGRDPEIVYFHDGGAVAKFSLATSEQWKDKSGAKQERTEWHKIEVYGKTAEVCRDYVTKGKSLYIEGQVTYEEWTDKDGNKRNTTKIKVSGPNSRIVLLGGRSDTGSRPPADRPPTDASEEVPF
jgi:single-strand DNA-binding protein